MAPDRSSASARRHSSTIKARAEEVRDIYREHFLGKTTLLNIDPLDYYTQALKVLNEGIDVQFGIGAHRDGLGQMIHTELRIREPIIDHLIHLFQKSHLAGRQRG